MDYYTTVIPGEESLYKEKGSKFIGYAFRVTDEDDVKEAIEQLKKEHHNARHWCYAYRLHPESGLYRTNDDGEPSGSAGKPIYGQILSADLYETLVVVVRYFGGTKLGVSGLITAYKAAAEEALRLSKTKEIKITRPLRVECDYTELDPLMRIVHNLDCDIIEQEFTDSCALEIGVLVSKVTEFRNSFNNFKTLKIEDLEG
jgi:uncharacterized YigZ family protein